MPHYIRLSYYAYEKNINLKFAKVAGPNNTQLVNKYKIETFPTIILLYQNKIHYYNFDINYSIAVSITNSGLLPCIK